MTAERPKSPHRKGPTTDRSPTTPREERQLRRDRAIEESLDVRPSPDAPFPTLEVRNPEHRTRYRVLLPAYPGREGAMCTCPDFARRAVGTCKHLEASWLYLVDHPLHPTPAAEGRGRELWDAWDRRRADLQRTGSSLRRRLRGSGRVLIEGPTA